MQIEERIGRQSLNNIARGKSSWDDQMDCRRHVICFGQQAEQQAVMPNTWSYIMCYNVDDDGVENDNW